MSMKDKYPTIDGWLHLRLSIVPGTKVTQELCLKFCGIKDLDNYEIAEFKHYKTVVRMVFRKIKDKADTKVSKQIEGHTG